MERRGSRTESGAAAVEFALVCTVFLPLLLGMLQYGLFFNDSLNARQGVRQGAREGVVKTFAACGGEAAELAKLRCSTKEHIGALTGPSSVKVYAPSGWVKGSPLVVCAMIESGAGNYGVLPMPNGGLIRSRTKMSIEQATPPVAVTSSADTAPAGADWSWC